MLKQYVPPNSILSSHCISLCLTLQIFLKKKIKQVKFQWEEYEIVKKLKVCGPH